MVGPARPPGSWSAPSSAMEATASMVETSAEARTGIPGRSLLRVGSAVPRTGKFLVVSVFVAG